MPWWNPASWRTAEVFDVRRWTSAKTSRLNDAHWADATDNTINQDIRESLADYRKKCLHEATENPFVAGMLHTHATDIIGAHGPIFQSQSSSERFNRAIEKAWADWFAMPDVNGVLSGVDLMRGWIPQLWTCGEFLNQITKDTRVSEGKLPDDLPGSRVVSMRLLEIHPRRMTTPIVPNPGTINVDGVEVDGNGRPLRFWIRGFGEDELGLYQVRPYDADGFIHAFQRIEANQVRGFPWLAPSLQTAADLRDLDCQILDGIRQVADWMVFFTCTDPGNAPVAMTGEAKTKRRMMRALPPGYDAKSVQGNSAQGINYTQFRNMRLAELGRVVSMPLMMVILDSGDHSYSSANFDAQIYARGNAATQSWLERVALQRLVRLVRREAAFVVPALRSVPEDWQITFTWPRPPHVDPVKVANALEMMLRMGVISEIEACGQLGLDYEQVAANIKRVGDIKDAAGIAKAIVTAATGNAANAEQRLESMISELRDQISSVMARSKVQNAV